jgi:hypothetical protein
MCTFYGRGISRKYPYVHSQFQSTLQPHRDVRLVRRISLCLILLCHFLLLEINQNKYKYN